MIVRFLQKTLLFLVLYPCLTSHAQDTAAHFSPGQRLQTLLKMYKGRAIPDTGYLNGVDSIAPLLVGGDSLPGQLGTYRELAFSREEWGKYRMHYYKFMAVQALDKGRNGTAVYYAQKQNEEGVRNGTLKGEDIPRSVFFAMSVYCFDKDFGRALTLYEGLRPAVKRLAAAIPQGKVSRENVYMAYSVLEQAAFAGTQTGNKEVVEEAVGLAGQMGRETRALPALYGDYQAFFNSTYHVIAYSRENAGNHMDSAGRLLETAIAEALSPPFPEALRPYCLFDLYYDAFDYYYRVAKYDSARHYLGLVRSLPSGLMDRTNIKLALLLDGESKLAAAGKAYEKAYGDLRRAYGIRDSAFYAVSSDRDNNLYALAEAGEARIEILKTQERRRQEQRFNLVLFTLLGAVLVGGGCLYWVYRSRVRHRILNIQLGLARNFHDEVGPMLLYANTLVKKEMQTHSTPGLEDIKTQLAYIMQAVRGISHDLKTGEMATVASFGEEARQLLGKIKGATGIDYTILQEGGSRVIPHFQLMHLRKMLNEMIGNSVKHAGCHSIRLTVKADDGCLNIGYSDDGPGIPDTGAGQGIGLRNLQERASLLRGSFTLHNAYPTGYSIEIKTPLS